MFGEKFTHTSANIHRENSIQLNKGVWIASWCLMKLVIKGAKTESSDRSNHCPISAELKTGLIWREKPFWKYNNSLLHDDKLTGEITVILNVKQKKKERKYAENNTEDHINKTTTANL